MRLLTEFFCDRNVGKNRDIFYIGGKKKITILTIYTIYANCFKSIQNVYVFSSLLTMRGSFIGSIPEPCAPKSHPAARSLLW